MFEEYGAHYFSGHDDCAEYFYSNNIAYFKWYGSGCCYHNISQDIPNDRLKYFIANTNPSINIDDDDNYEIGVDGAADAFATIIID